MVVKLPLSNIFLNTSRRNLSHTNFYVRQYICAKSILNERVDSEDVRTEIVFRRKHMA